MPNEKLAALKSRFTWVSDGKLDSWHVLPATGPVEGDCDDYAYRALLDVAGSTWRAWWWLLTFQAWFFRVKSPRGNPHMALWVWRWGWTDNYKDRFTDSVAPHTGPIPFPWPLVVLKLLIGLLDRT